MSDSAVRAAAAAGDRTVEDLGESCGAGTDCGGCHPLLEELLAGADLATAAA